MEMRVNFDTCLNSTVNFRRRFRFNLAQTDSAIFRDGPDQAIAVSPAEFSKHFRGEGHVAFPIDTLLNAHRPCLVHRIAHNRDGQFRLDRYPVILLCCQQNADL